MDYEVKLTSYLLLIFTNLEDWLCILKWLWVDVLCYKCLKSLDLLCLVCSAVPLN